MSEFLKRLEFITIKPEKIDNPCLTLAFIGKADGFREYLKTLKHFYKLSRKEISNGN